MNLDQEFAIPAATDLEKTIIGTVFNDNMAYYEATEAGLTEQDFYLDSHRRIWRAIDRLMEDGTEAQLGTVAEMLNRSKEVATVGGVSYLAELTEGLPRRSAIRDYVRIVRDKALARNLIQIAESTISRAWDQGSTAATLASDLTDQLLAATSHTFAGGRTVLEILPGAMDAFERDMNRTGSVAGANLLTPEIDRLTCGLADEELCLLAGRPGSGKTEAALQIALKNARKGLRVHIQSLEMRSNQLLRRLWRLMARVPVSAMRDPRCLNPEQRTAIKAAQEELSDLPIFIDDTHELSLSEFRSRAVLAARRWKADLMLVDYAQLLIVPRARGIIEAAPKQAEALRHIARDYCRTIALAQIRRAPPNDLNRYPDVEDILGSSAFEQAAQVILLLHRTREEKRYTGEDFCFLGKMRELQSLESFGIEATKWGEFRDRYNEADHGRNWGGK